jgi:hypothetical protein
MARFATAARALRGPFKKLVQKLALTLKKVLIKQPGGRRWPASSASRDAARTSPPPHPRRLAAGVAEATGGEVKLNKGGFTVTVPHAGRGIIIRVMEHGGGRSNYYRVSVPGMAAYGRTGEATTDAALSHIEITEQALDEVLSIVAKIKGGS